MSAIGEYRQGMRDTPPRVDRPSEDEEIAKERGYLPATPPELNRDGLRAVATLILQRQEWAWRYIADREIEDPAIAKWLLAADIIDPTRNRFYSKFYFRAVVWAMQTLGHFDEPDIPLT